MVILNKTLETTKFGSKKTEHTHTKTSIQNSFGPLIPKTRTSFSTHPSLKNHPKTTRKKKISQRRESENPKNNYLESLELFVLLYLWLLAILEPPLVGYFFCTICLLLLSTTGATSPSSVIAWSAGRQCAADTFFMLAEHLPLRLGVEAWPLLACPPFSFATGVGVGVGVPCGRQHEPSSEKLKNFIDFIFGFWLWECFLRRSLTQKREVEKLIGWRYWWTIGICSFFFFLALYL